MFQMCAGSRNPLLYKMWQHALFSLSSESKRRVHTQKEKRPIKIESSGVDRDGINEGVVVGVRVGSEAGFTLVATEGFVLVGPRIEFRVSRNELA